MPQRLVSMYKMATRPLVKVNTIVTLVFIERNKVVATV